MQDWFVWDKFLLEILYLLLLIFNINWYEITNVNYKNDEIKYENEYIFIQFNLNLLFQLFT